jgi:hypothetical protein
VVKSDNVRQYHGMGAILVAFTVLEVLYTVLEVPRLREGQGPVLFGGMAMSVSFAIGATASFMHGRWVNRREYARQAAARGERTAVRLALPQPAPGGTRWNLPVTIIAGPSWRRLLANGVLGLVVIQWFAFLIALQPGTTFLYALWVPTVAVVFVGGFFVFAVLINSTWQEIDVSQHGLTVVSLRGGSRGNPNAPSISWHQAHLFAIVGGGKHENSAVCYELSGPESIVRWVRVRRGMPYYPLWLAAATKPKASFDDYEREMDALLSLIAEKTGLPLYDLRDVG